MRAGGLLIVDLTGTSLVPRPVSDRRCTVGSVPLLFLFILDGNSLSGSFL